MRELQCEECYIEVSDEDAINCSACDMLLCQKCFTDEDCPETSTGHIIVS